MDEKALKETVRLVIIVSDFAVAANVGGSVETKARSFDILPEMAAYILQNRGKWTTISIALEDSTQPESDGQKEGM